MAVKFNPFTGQLQIDQVGAGGGSSYLDGEVQNFSALPETVGSPAVDSAYLVREAEGTWLLSRKPAGIYIRTANTGTRASDWTYAGEFPDVFNDANFVLYDTGDSTKNLQFQLSAISTGTTRTLTVPDASGTITLNGHTHSASDIASGTLDNARINFAAPAAIGSTTPSTGAFTTLSANNGTITASAPVLDLSQTWNNSGVTFTGFRFNVTNTNSSALSLFADFQVGGTTQFSVRRDGLIFARNRIEIQNTSIGFQTSAASNGASPVRYASDTNGVGQIYTSGNVVELLGTTATNAQEARLYGTFTSSTNYQRMTIKSVRQTLSALSGASATTTGTFIPDGAVVVGVTTRVTTLLTGATGYTIGDGTDADRWGDITGTAVGTTSDNRDWTAGTIECFTAGGNVTLTAKGSNFTDGAIEICVFYLAGEAD